MNVTIHGAPKLLLRSLLNKKPFPNLILLIICQRYRNDLKQGFRQFRCNSIKKLGKNFSYFPLHIFFS